MNSGRFTSFRAERARTISLRLQPSRRRRAPARTRMDSRARMPKS